MEGSGKALENDVQPARCELKRQLNSSQARRTNLFVLPSHAENKNEIIGASERQIPRKTREYVYTIEKV